MTNLVKSAVFDRSEEQKSMQALQNLFFFPLAEVNYFFFFVIQLNVTYGAIFNDPWILFKYIFNKQTDAQFCIF